MSAETERREDIWEEAEAQYPLIAAPTFAKWIGLVLVSEETYCVFDGENDEEDKPYTKKMHGQKMNA